MSKVVAPSGEAERFGGTHDVPEFLISRELLDERPLPASIDRSQDPGDQVGPLDLRQAMTTPRAEHRSHSGGSTTGE